MQGLSLIHAHAHTHVSRATQTGPMTCYKTSDTKEIHKEEKRSPVINLRPVAAMTVIIPNCFQESPILEYSINIHVYMPDITEKAL